MADAAAGAATGPAASPSLNRAAALLALLLFATYAYFVAPPSWNENSRFDLVMSMVERHRLDIDPHQHNTGDKALRAGHFYSDKAPGASLLAVPPYAAYRIFLRLTGASRPQSVQSLDGGQGDDDDLRYLVNPSFRRALYVCNLFTNALAGALLGAAFFLFLCRRLLVAASPAAVATLALGLGSLVLPYATMFYGHVLAAAFSFGAYVLLLEAGDDRSARPLVIAGLFAGLAVLVELPTAPAVALLAGVLLWRLPERRRALWFAVGFAGPAVVLMAYQFAAFGSPWRSGYAFVSRPEFAQGMSRGLMGIGLPRPQVLWAQLFGRARGLLYLSPVLLLAFVGLVRRVRVEWQVRPRRPEVALAALVVAYFLLMNAGYYMWYGGSALGPRHLIPALPFLCLGLPFAFARPRWWLLAALMAVSVSNQLLATAVQPAAPLVQDVLREHVYLHALRGEVALMTGAANLGTLAGLHGLASLLPLVVFWALGLPVLIPLLPPATPRPNISNPERRAADEPVRRA